MNILSFNSGSFDNEFAPPACKVERSNLFLNTINNTVVSADEPIAIRGFNSSQFIQQLRAADPAIAEQAAESQLQAYDQGLMPAVVCLAGNDSSTVLKFANTILITGRIFKTAGVSVSKRIVSSEITADHVQVLETPIYIGSVFCSMRATLVFWFHDLPN